MLLMNTVNQCVAQQQKTGQTNPVAPLIQDIELLSKEQQKANQQKATLQTDGSEFDVEKVS